MNKQTNGGNLDIIMQLRRVIQFDQPFKFPIIEMENQSWSQWVSSTQEQSGGKVRNKKAIRSERMKQLIQAVSAR